VLPPSTFCAFSRLSTSPFDLRHFFPLPPPPPLQSWEVGLLARPHRTMPYPFTPQAPPHFRQQREFLRRLNFILFFFRDLQPSLRSPPSPLIPQTASSTAPWRKRTRPACESIATSSCLRVLTRPLVGFLRSLFCFYLPFFFFSPRRRFLRSVICAPPDPGPRELQSGETIPFFSTRADDFLFHDRPHIPDYCLRMSLKQNGRCPLFLCSLPPPRKAPTGQTFYLMSAASHI